MVVFSVVSDWTQAKEWEKQQKKLAALKKGGQSKGKAEDTVSRPPSKDADRKIRRGEERGERGWGGMSSLSGAEGLIGASLA